jgi:hypothetical protein
MNDVSSQILPIFASRCELLRRIVLDESRADEDRFHADRGILAPV